MKKNLKLFLCLLLVFLMLFSVVACHPNEQGPNDDEESSQDETTAEITNEDERNTFDDIAWVANGESDYIIWVQKELYENEEVKSRITELVQSVEKKTGAVLDVMTDDLALSGDAPNPAILIGKTVFEESNQMKSAPKDKDFAITCVGNKIMIYCENEIAAASAVRYFYNKVIGGQKIVDKTILFTEDHQYFSKNKYGVGSVVVDGKELREYRIVVSKNATVDESSFAYKLRIYLTEAYGCTLEMATDESTAKYEILVGKTSRTNITAQDLGYGVSVDSGKVQLMAKDMLGFQGLYEYITNTFLKSGSSLDYTYKDGFYCNETTKLSINDGTKLATDSFGDVRVMLYNVYGSTNTCGSPSVRQPYQIEIVKTYMPDVLGFQEYSNQYHSGFTSKLTSLGYKRVDGSTATNIYTPLFYLPTKLQVLQSGFHLYTGANDNSKGVEWAVFKDKATGKIFMAMSTHFMWNDPDIGPSMANTTRISNAREILDIISDVQSNPAYANIPVLMGGDLNCRTDSTPHTILKQGGLTSAWDKAFDKNDSSGYHSYSTYDATLKAYTIVPKIEGKYKDSAIDHMYVNNKTTVNVFVSLSDDYSQWTSDHMPIIAEISLR